jgi:hypothetical protein
MARDGPADLDPQRDDPLDEVFYRARYWPFPVPPAEQLTLEGRQIVTFLDSALREDWRPYEIHDAVFGATAASGRVGEVVRRGGRGRYWEIILVDAKGASTSRFFDGFVPASDAVLSWLKGDSMDSIVKRFNNAIVTKPGERGW